jgi:hypothetical protein
MAESHIISGLKAKQHDIRSRISELEDQVKACRKDLACIGEALRIFGDPDGFYVKPEPLFSRGDLSTAIFDTLRGIPEGLDLSVITEAVAKSNGLDLNDATLGPLIRNRVTAALNRLCGKGELASRKGIGGIRVWRIAP